MITLVENRLMSHRMQFRTAFPNSSWCHFNRISWANKHQLIDMLWIEWDVYFVTRIYLSCSITTCKGAQKAVFFFRKANCCHSYIRVLFNINLGVKLYNMNLILWPYTCVTKEPYYQILKANCNTTQSTNGEKWRQTTQPKSHNITLFNNTE